MIDWDYLNLAYMKEFPAARMAVTIPTTGVYGAYYCQAINATAPHPYAARLWQEFLYSDVGQLLWLKGTRTPPASPTWRARKVVPKALLKALPSATLYAKVKFAGPAQQTEGEGDDHGASGRRRSARSLSETRSRSRRAPRGRREPAGGVLPRVARRRAVLRLRDRLPAAPGGQVSGRRVQERRRRLHARQRRGQLYDRSCIRAFKNSIEISLVTALVGGLLGFLIAYSAIRDGHAALACAPR